MKDAHNAYEDYLLGRMADVMGLNLGLELDESRLSKVQLQRAMRRCDACGQKDACVHWLDGHGDGSREAPELCPNKGLLDRLREE